MKNYMHTPLRSSWVQNAFTKPKTRGIVVVNKSRSRRLNMTVKVEGQFVHSVVNPNFY